MDPHEERDFELTITLKVRASEAAVKDAVLRSIGGLRDLDEDPDAVSKQAKRSDYLGLPAFNEQPWRLISEVTKTGDSAFNFLVGEVLRFGFEKLAPDLGQPSTGISHRGDTAGDGGQGRV